MKRPGRLEVTAVGTDSGQLLYAMEGTLLKIELASELSPGEQIVLNLNWELTCAGLIQGVLGKRPVLSA